jgi:hypothetical protein
MTIERISGSITSDLHHPGIECSSPPIHCPMLYLFLVGLYNEPTWYRSYGNITSFTGGGRPQVPFVHNFGIKWTPE